MDHRHTQGPAWLSPEDEKKWNNLPEEATEERPPLIAKPFDSLPATPRSAPAVTNGLPEGT
ncbi:hypothetical protein JST97_13120 [bacterium]|nr:hypothetical protein [bacterium]